MPKIMLVEDDNNLREIYGARLQAEGYDIVSAKDGEEALAMAVKEKPDLIISDVMMPRISGFDMLDILRNAPETKETKVIMMTALSQAEDKARADKLGADRYLVKSQVTLEDVANVVKEVLGGESTAEAADAAAATPVPTPQPPAEPTTAAPAVETPAPAVAVESAPETPVPAAPAADIAPTPAAPADPTVITPTIPPTDDTTASTTDDTATAATPTEPIPGPKIPPVEVKVETPPEPVPATEPTPVEAATAAEPIKVELPAAATDEAVATEAKDTPTPEEKPAEAPATPVGEAPAEEKPAGSEIGPNLAEALAAEAKEETPAGETPAVEPAPAPAPEAPADPAAATPDLPPIVPAETPEPASAEKPAETPAVETPTEAAPTTTKIPVTMVDTPETTPPAVANGTPTHAMVQPTQPAPGTTDDKPSGDNESYLDDKPASVNGKKVITPINDPTTKPDLNALLAAEEHKAAVQTPAVSTVIAPGQTTQVANPQPGETIATVQVEPAPETLPTDSAKKDELNNISL